MINTTFYVLFVVLSAFIKVPGKLKIKNGFQSIRIEARFNLISPLLWGIRFGSFFVGFLLPLRRDRNPTYKSGSRIPPMGGQASAV